MALSTGTRLGPYEILAPAGAGGMGEVYRARDARLDRIVAVKVLPAHLSEDPVRRQRFEGEARAVSRLSHPHICTLYDVGREDGIDFLVMEYLEGETLADRLGKGALPTDQVLRHAVEIASALDKAHRQGIVHRDLKPANIILTRSGAKLLDFGLAKASASTAPGFPGLSATPTQSRPLTAEGTVVGTVQYMAPEQLEGKEADARSDLFAFGAVLYEMATGRRSFEGKSQASLIAAILSSDPPPIVTLQPLAPPALDRVVRHCLAKDPEERWQTAHDLMLELRWVAAAGPQAEIPATAAAWRVTRERVFIGSHLGPGRRVAGRAPAGVRRPEFRGGGPAVGASAGCGHGPSSGGHRRSEFPLLVRRQPIDRFLRRRQAQKDRGLRRPPADAVRHVECPGWDLEPGRDDHLRARRQRLNLPGPRVGGVSPSG